MRWDAHLCVDMQNLFADATPWQTAWMRRVLPNVMRLIEPRPEATIFSRFIPPRSPEEAAGAWRGYYRKWSCLTGDTLPASTLDLMPELRVFVPPAQVIDKRVYSPWFTAELITALRAREARRVVISGGETEVCVLATALGAIDHGLEVILASDALCRIAQMQGAAIVT